MKVTPRYYPVGRFINFLIEPETREEQDALIRAALRSKEIQDMNELVAELEKGIKENGTLQDD